MIAFAFGLAWALITACIMFPVIGIAVLGVALCVGGAAAVWFAYVIRRDFPRARARERSAWERYR